VGTPIVVTPLAGKAELAETKRQLQPVAPERQEILNVMKDQRRVIDRIKREAKKGFRLVGMPHRLSGLG